MPRPVKYITTEQKNIAHVEAQRKYIDRKKSGVPIRKKTDPKKISNGDEPFTLTPVPPRS